MQTIQKQYASANFTRTPEFSLIIPCFRSEAFLRQNVLLLAELMAAQKLSFEFIFVEDFSPDGTKAELQRLVLELEAKQISFKLVFHDKNFGRGRAVKTGIATSSGKICGFIDIDLENRPEAIFPMHALIAQGEADVVVGTRYLPNNDSNLLRRILHLVYKALIHWIVQLPVPDTETGLKLFSREKISPLADKAKDDHWFWDTEIILVSARAGLRIRDYPVAFIRDREKISTVRVFRDIARYLFAIYRYIRNA